MNQNVGLGDLEIALLSTTHETIDAKLKIVGNAAESFPRAQMHEMMIELATVADAEATGTIAVMVELDWIDQEGETQTAQAALTGKFEFNTLEIDQITLSTDLLPTNAAIGH